jgi:von Willebrand factor type A domain
MRSSFLTRSLSCAAMAASVILAASCGSRTGLFVEGPGSSGGVGTGSGDGSLDVTPDVIEEPTPCIPGTFTFQLATAQLMFVLDRSGSMDFSLTSDVTPPPGTPSRWTTLRDALFQTITPFDQSLAMGAKFFPDPVPPDALDDPTVACQSSTGVDVPPATGNVNAILNVLDTTSPAGGTPTASALTNAASFLSIQRSVNRTIVLATDGAPNCNASLDPQTCTCTTPMNPCQRDNDQYSCLDDIATLGVITDIFQNRKIPVYVIGIGSQDDPQFLSVLDQMAVAGGRPRATEPKFFGVASEAEMKDAFATIESSIAECTYLTPSSPTDPNAIVVQINGQNIPRDPTHTNGWDWVDQTFGELELFGPACVAAQGGEGGPITPVSGIVSCMNP